MNYLVLLSLLLSVVTFSDGLVEGITKPAYTHLKPLDNLLNPVLDWKGFKEKFDKKFEGVEDLKRQLNYEKAVLNIAEHNALADLGLKHYTLGVNKYSDLSREDISNKLCGFKGSNDYPSEAEEFKPLKSSKIPSFLDWKDEGYLAPVKDQGECGACWAFSTTGALEAQFAKKTGKLVSLSEQHLIDCSQSEGNIGCDGGWMNQAYKYLRNNGGITTEANYPYEEASGKCSGTDGVLGISVTGYVNIPEGDEKALREAVATVGPVNCAINAEGDFPYYESGVYDPDDCNNTISDLTHAMLVVGYGSENDQDYWLLRNSWGDSYGIDGYIKLARNKNNVCGVATKASYPVVKTNCSKDDSSDSSTSSSSEDQITNLC